MEPVSDFHFTALEDLENCFRLLRLLPAQDDGGALHTDLAAFWRDSAPYYIPVSYT